MISIVRPAAVVGAALVLASSPAFADDKDDRIEKLEKETAELRKEMAELKAQREQPLDVDTIRASVDDYLAHAESANSKYVGPGGVLRPTGKLTIGGYFSTRYVSSNASGSMPSFSDMRLVPQLHADLTDRIAFSSEFEFEHGGVSDEVHGEIDVEYAELSFRFRPEFTFKAGTLLIPFGAFNQSHDDPINELSSRPNVDSFVVPAAFSSPGVGASGAFDVGGDSTLSYDVALTNGFRDDFSTEEGAGTARGLFEEDDNHGKTAFGRFGFVPTTPFLDVLNVGVSGALGEVGPQSDRLTGYGFDASAKSGPWEFKGEFDRLGIDRPSGSPPPIDAAGKLGPVRGLDGWYAQLLHRFTDPWVRDLPFAQKDASVAIVLRRDVSDLNVRVHGAGPDDDERAWSFGINYRPTTKTVIKLEYRRASSGAPGPQGRDRDLFALEFATYF